jgi:hypothetical protein
MVVFDERALKARLERIEFQGRPLFALSCAERLFPLYKLYSEEAGHGAPWRLRSTLDQLWKSAHRGPISGEQPFLSEYESLIPGEAVERNKGTLLGPLAEDTVAALAYTCQYVATRETQNAAWAARCAYEAVDYVAHTLEGMHYGTPEAEAAILKKDYVQAELLRQLRDIAEIEGAAHAGTRIEHLVETFRSRATSEGMDLASIVSVLYKK